jgi:hypothetical protein
MQIKKLSLTLLLVANLSACDDNSTGSKPTTPNASDDTELANDLDEKLFKQLNIAMDTINQDKLWPGYDLRNTPLYLIRTTLDNNGQLKIPEAAFIVNPYDNISKENALGKNEVGSLNVVQYTDKMQNAADALTGINGNGVFEFTYKIKGNNHYLQAYSTRGVNVEFTLLSSDVGFIAHEAFHNYQSEKFTHNATSEQLNPMNESELAQYPLNLTTITTQVYLLELFKHFPNDINKINALAALQKYAVVVEAMLEADKPMEHKDSKIYRHGLNQERTEGSAQYIDVFVERAILPLFQNKKFIKNVPYEMDRVNEAEGLAAKLQKRSDVINYFAFESFYATGGSIMFLLNQVNYDLKHIEQGVIPYEAALELSELEEQERSYLLDEIHTSNAWQEAVIAAKRYILLLDK